MLDAYAIRKAVPRILIAAIAINLSIYLCVAFIDIANVLGNGIGSLISKPFVGDGITLDGKVLDGNLVNGGVLTILFGLILKSIVGLGAAGIISTLFGFIMIIAFVALAVLFTLIIRQGLVLFLTVISPVAIALLVLPGTEKYFKKWLDLFITTLMVYPIIAIMFGISNAMTAILLNNANAAGSSTDEVLKLLSAIIVLYAPLVLIPFAFKLAGGAISTIMNAASGVTGKRGDAMRKGVSENNIQRKAERSAKLKAGQLYEGKKWIPGSQTVARRINKAGLSYGTGLRGHFGLGQTGANARANSLEATVTETMKSANFQKIANNDNALRAGTFASESEALLGLQEEGMNREDAIRAIQQFKTSGMRFGDRATQMASAKQMVATGTSFNGQNGMEDMVGVLARASSGNSSSASSLSGFANATNKQVGRWELAPGFSALNDMVQAEAGTGLQSDKFKTEYGDLSDKTKRARMFDEATLKAIREATDPGTLARTAKPQVFSNLNAVFDRATDRGDKDLLHTASQLITEAESNRYSTSGGVTDQIDIHYGPETGQPRLYGGSMDPRMDPRNRPEEPPKPKKPAE